MIGDIEGVQDDPVCRIRALFETLENLALTRAWAAAVDFSWV
jgi:hypothetical protein